MTATAVPGTPVAAALVPALGSLPAVALDDLVGLASLQTRVDRKYLITGPVLTAMIDRLGESVAALDIDGRRVFGYSSVYFDTPDLLCFREHRQDRRRRFKVRTRTYTDSGQCMLEVKAVGPRGQTVKHRLAYLPADAGRLTGRGRGYAAFALHGHPAVGGLQPILTTDYRRATLLDPRAGSRLTIDVGLHFTGSRVAIAAPEDTVIIETKTAGPPCQADRALRWLGARPISISKYCIGVALVHPGLPANPWHRVLRRHFGVAP